MKEFAITDDLECSHYFSCKFIGLGSPIAAIGIALSEIAY
jgi:hypothetical protein